MEASTALTESMLQITATKLSSLTEQQRRWEINKSSILEDAASETHTRDKVEALLDGYKRYRVQVPSDLSAENIRGFLEQSRNDPSVSSSLLQGWQTTLEQALDAPSRKYEHASLFGRLVMEWLTKAKKSPSESSESEDTGEFTHLGRKEMYDQRKEWESIVFATDPKTDPSAIKAYLSSIFSSTSQAKKVTKSPLENLRKTLGSFDLETLDVDSLKTCMLGVLKIDLLSDVKRKTVSEFLGSPMMLREMVDVLNMQIDALESWSWGKEGISVDVRRALNGKYRVYMDEEILQALFLYFVGMKWAVHLKTAFLAFFQSGAWKQSTRQSMDRQARQRRRDFLSHERESSEDVRNERRDRYKRDYFLLQLPSSFATLTDSYDEMSDAGHSELKSPMAMKQSLLHLISTEALVNTRLYGSFTILQSDFRWFGPSLPHATIMAVLRFFGVSDQWLEFFKNFLEAPVRFAMDEPDAQTQIRRSGVPLQHRLSDALSEAVLFCLDFAVNKSTESNLYRLHDDIWFWGDKDTTIKAWRTVQQFTDVMGLHLNNSKTGAVEIFGDPISAREFDSSDVLPSGPITWGFLKIGPAGTWTIDDAQTTPHIRELQTQLEACKSIFAWVQAWNIYVARFLSNNFGDPAQCLGRPHLDMVILAFERIQSMLFAPDALTGGNVIEHLRAKLSARFAVSDIPDGFFLFPIELGGLGLINPLISLFGVYKKSLLDPMAPIAKALETEEMLYEKARKDWENGTTSVGSSLQKEDFMSLEEYTRYVEETSWSLLQAYCKLTDVPSQTLVESTPDVVNARKSVKGLKDEVYDAWVMQLYGPEIIRRYGGLAMGDERLLPIGLVDMLRSEKIRWQG